MLLDSSDCVQDMDMADQPPRKRRLPKGTSDYQVRLVVGMRVQPL